MSEPKKNAIDEAIKEFVKDRVGGVIVNDSDGNICYKDSRILLSEKGFKLWNKKRPAMHERKTWEFTDRESEHYYRVETATIDTQEIDYQCHLFTDISDYASLFQDISNYSMHIAGLSDFQKSILAKLSQEYDAFLPELTNFCKATDSALYMRQEGSAFIRKSSYTTRLNRRRIQASDEIISLLHVERFDFSDGYYCFLSDRIDDQEFSLFLRRGANFNEEYFRDASVYNVVRLFIENGILRDKIVYKSEHDELTGLYNKGKYMAMMESEFDHPQSIAVYYFDVNNLKTINDTLGHEAGDHLIVCSAASISAIADENVYPFRMGGDEFLAVAVNITEEQAKSIHQRWQKALDKINEEEDGDLITIACGFEFATAPYSLDQVIANADGKMYINKREIKKKYGLPERG